MRLIRLLQTDKKKTLRLVVHRHIDIFEWNVTIGEYLMKLAARRGFNVLDMYEDEKSNSEEELSADEDDGNNDASK